jgi:hypothetical protein
MKDLVKISLILTLTSCSILNKDIGLYSSQLDLKQAKSIKSGDIGESVKLEHCNRMYFIFPTSQKSQFDIIDDLIAQDKKYNSLVDVNVETTMFMIPPLYSSICHYVKGKRINISAQ